MAKRKVELTEEQKEKNEQILARIEKERQKLFEETRKLQQQFRDKFKRKSKESS